MQQFNKSMLHFHFLIQLIILSLYYVINDSAMICNYRHSLNCIGNDHLTYEVIAITRCDTDPLYITIYISTVFIFNEYCMLLLTELIIRGIIFCNILLHNIGCSQFYLIRNNYYYYFKYFKSILNRKQLLDDIVILYNVAVIILLLIYRYRMLISITYVGVCACTCINPSVYICVCILIDMCATSTCMLPVSHISPRDRGVTCECEYHPLRVH